MHFTIFRQDLNQRPFSKGDERKTTGPLKLQETGITEPSLSRRENKAKDLHSLYQVGCKLTEITLDGFPSPPPLAASPLDDHCHTEAKNVHDVNKKEDLPAIRSSAAPSTNQNPLSMELTCETECNRNPLIHVSTECPEAQSNTTVTGGGVSVVTTATNQMSALPTLSECDKHKVS